MFVRLDSRKQSRAINPAKRPKNKRKNTMVCIDIVSLSR